LTSILDGCDGEVARAKKMTSRLGASLDFWGDNVVHVAVFYGLGLGLFRDSGRDVYRRLGMVAAAGTIVSAALAAYQTQKRGNGHFTSVAGHSTAAGSGWRRSLVRLSDSLARRDFIYLVVVLALIGRLDWFLWTCAIGVNLYAIVLTVLVLVIP
ncbi:MAG TPA: CDP-alcohol phosphatidyltransferase family protein, partial [Elusimicrobiota bacterium]|nr:CDP-alcohol phosphatidyltransferase family protein [Elusimicrobiota bacterium]